MWDHVGKEFVSAVFVRATELDVLVDLRVGELWVHPRQVRGRRRGESSQEGELLDQSRVAQAPGPHKVH